jgi:hypothetical protein
MPRACQIAIVSDVHYAGPDERQRGNDYEYRDLPSRWQRVVCRLYRRHIWLRAPMDHNHLLDRFLEASAECDHVFALGDYSCDSAFVGVSDDATLESAQECLGTLRRQFGAACHALIGDHELGKFPLFGRRGGLRFSSWERARHDLGLEPFWQTEIGPYCCVGITSSLLMLPVYADELLEGERASWEAVRSIHLDQIRQGFAQIPPHQPVLLFCHDPSALSFLAAEPAVRHRLPQIQRTFVGHLHSSLVLWKSQRLAGMPRINFLGHAVRRMTTALREARSWRPFHVQLCPSLAGVELLKDGGFLTANASDNPLEPVQHRLPR